MSCTTMDVGEFFIIEDCFRIASGESDSSETDVEQMIKEIKAKRRKKTISKKPKSLTSDYDGDVDDDVDVGGLRRPLSDSLVPVVVACSSPGSCSSPGENVTIPSHSINGGDNVSLARQLNFSVAAGSSSLSDTPENHTCSVSQRLNGMENDVHSGDVKSPRKSKRRKSKRNSMPTTVVTRSSRHQRSSSSSQWFVPPDVKRRSRKGMSEKGKEKGQEKGQEKEKEEQEVNAVEQEEEKEDEEENIDVEESYESTEKQTVPQKRRKKTKRITYKSRSSKKKAKDHDSNSKVLAGNDMPELDVDGSEEDEVEEGEGEGGGEEEEEEEEGIAFSPGGRMYRRFPPIIPNNPTPGVRRSKRARIAPCRPWKGEFVDFDMRRQSGVKLKGMLVRVEEDMERRKPRKINKLEDADFPMLTLYNKEGKILTECKVAYCVDDAEKVDGKGKPIEDGESTVAISRVFSGASTSIGVINLEPGGMKDKSRAEAYDIHFYTIKGKVKFTISESEYDVPPNFLVIVPAGAQYFITNLSKKTSSIYYQIVKAP